MDSRRRRSVAELLTHFLTATAPLIATPRELALRLAAAGAAVAGADTAGAGGGAAEGSLHGQWQAIQSLYEN